MSSVLRTILMKLVHGRTYEIVNENMTDSQIGARKNKSVQNHLFVLNSVISDVMSSVKKTPIDITIMDFKQMFDSEELETVLNSFYEAGIKDDMLGLVYEANKSVTFAVKTPSGLTSKRTIRNKIMQGDVMSPLVSSNMVDDNITKMAMATQNFYMYKNKVSIPPLLMQDDTLAISTCGNKTRQMVELLNTCTNIMCLQFGRDKCVKMHIGKRHNLDICPEVKVDTWDEVIIKHEGKHEVKDQYIGREAMKSVKDKKYLGSILTHDMKNSLNIKEKTDRGVGIVNRIMSSVSERPYGKHTYRAALIMREAMLIGSMLTNSESWINLTQQD